MKRQVASRYSSAFCDNDLVCSTADNAKNYFHEANENDVKRASVRAADEVHRLLVFFAEKLHFATTFLEKL